MTGTVGGVVSGVPNSPDSLALRGRTMRLARVC